MALQRSGLGLYYPNFIQPMVPGVTPALATTGLIDATGEMVAWTGYVWFPAGTGTKDIHRVQFRFGAVTKAGGSALTLSLQDPSTTAGPAFQPDGTQDQTVAIANADAAFVSNTWYRSGALSADRTVSCGDKLSVVLEYDGAGRLGADSVVVSAWTNGNTGTTPLQDTFALLTGGSWTALATVPILVLEMSDGTYGTIEGCVPYMTSNAHSFTVSTGGSDEFAVPFTVPFACKVDALYAGLLLNAGADCEVILYQGTTALQTVVINSKQVNVTGSTRTIVCVIPETSLTVGTTYYVAVRPTTATAVNAYSVDVNTAGFLDLMPGGATAAHTTRVNQGAWAATTATRRFLAGVRISSLSDDIGAGGAALLVHPGMDGGMRG